MLKKFLAQIMDFMQCINFKSRLDREREMIRRKIRSSTLYRKPSFTKSAFNIYNPHEVTKVSVISKNVKINEFKDEPLRKSKSPLLVNDEPEDEYSNEEKSILCIGNKYLDLTSNLMGSAPICKSMSTSTLNLVCDDKLDSDFERAISQSHLSPATAMMVSGSMMKKLNDEDEENLKKPNNAKSVSSPFLYVKSDNDDDADTQSPSEKRKNHKIIKKSALLYNNHLGAGCGKYSDAQRTELVDELPNSIVIADNNNNTNNNSYKTLNNITANNNHTIKTVKKSAAVTRKIKSSNKIKNSDAHRDSLKSTTTRKAESS